jgi:quercetin dioxygenase-like cupin family protein
MKLNIYDVGGEIVKDNETYLLKDNKTLKNLILSSTDLKPGQSTRGHSHAGQEEVYCDVVLIPDGAFHRVHNTQGHSTLYFVCVFDGKRNH